MAIDPGGKVLTRTDDARKGVGIDRGGEANVGRSGTSGDTRDSNDVVVLGELGEGKGGGVKGSLEDSWRGPTPKEERQGQGKTGDSPLRVLFSY